MRRVLMAVMFVVAGAALTFAQETKETPAVEAPKTPDQPTAGDAEKEKLPPKGIIHLQEVKDPPEVRAEKPCNNYSFAASLAAVLAYQKAEIKQDYWVDKYYGGSFCLEEIGSINDIIKKTDGEYTLDDGRHVQLTLQYFEGLPSNTSALLVPIMTDEILVLFIEGHADVLIGAMWDDWLSKRGERMIDLKELHLLDPLAEPEKQRVNLSAGTGDFVKVTGFMKVKATEVGKQYWPK